MPRPGFSHLTSRVGGGLGSRRPSASRCLEDLFTTTDRGDRMQRVLLVFCWLTIVTSGHLPAANLEAAARQKRAKSPPRQGPLRVRAA